VAAWSVNPDEVIYKEEGLSPRLDERLKAAQTCAKKGYRIGLHFDPIIYYEGWEENYKMAVEKIFQYLSPEDIIWISMGTFRYNPNLKNYIKRRYPESKIIYGEQFLSVDGKMRYIKPVRTDIYSKMLSFIRKHSDDVFVYLCMETSEVWKKVFDLDLNDNSDLEVLFPRR
ncbi:DNA photolyase, partial [bacterium]|nr:DNA photolyase [bacterium]